MQLFFPTLKTSSTSLSSLEISVLVHIHWVSVPAASANSYLLAWNIETERKKTRPSTAVKFYTQFHLFLLNYWESDILAHHPLQIDQYSPIHLLSVPALLQKGALSNQGFLEACTVLLHLSVWECQSYILCLVRRRNRNMETVWVGRIPAFTPIVTAVKIDLKYILHVTVYGWELMILKHWVLYSTYLKITKAKLIW